MRANCEETLGVRHFIDKVIYFHTGNKVKTGRGLIVQHDSRLHDQGACNTYAFSLTA
jgi:hypothetical protein